MASGTRGYSSYRGRGRKGKIFLAIVLILIILIGTTMAFLCFLKGVSVIGPDKALLIGALEPVSATVISFLWLHTAFTIADIIGFVCIVLALAFLYPLNKKKVEENVAELAARRNK